MKRNRTPFGNYMRILRIKRNETMKDTAKKLRCTSSFVSAVETGKRDIPYNWRSVIIKKYSLSESEKKELDECIEATPVLCANVTFYLNQYTEEQREEILALKKRLDEANKVND